MNSRKIARIDVGFDLLELFLKNGGVSVLKTDLPKDAEIVGVGESANFIDNYPKKCPIFVHSDSYKELKGGESIPEEYVTIKSIRLGDDGYFSKDKPLDMVVISDKCMIEIVDYYGEEKTKVALIDVDYQDLITKLVVNEETRGMVKKALKQYDELDI